MTTLTGQDIGRAHAATRAVLARHLGAAGLDFEHWVAVNAVGSAGGLIDVDAYHRRFAGGLKLGPEQAEAITHDLADQGLLEVAGGQVALTEAGSAAFGQVSAAVGRIVDLFYGDLPEADLEVAHRVLATVTARADAELASPTLEKG